MDITNCVLAEDEGVLFLNCGDEVEEVVEGQEALGLRVVLVQRAERPWVVLEDPDNMAIVELDCDMPLVLPMPDWEVFEQYRGDWAKQEIEEVMTSSGDLLGDAVLSRGEPDLATVRAQMPPLLDHAFLADGRLVDRPIVNQDGRIDGYWEVPLADEDTTCHMAVCLVGGVFIVHQAGRAQQLTFMLPGAEGEPVVWLRRKPATDADFTYLRCGPAAQEVEAAKFYVALKAALSDAYCEMQLRTPERELQLAAHKSLELGLLTFKGIAPRYGMGSYGKPRHDSFPPTTISAVQALLAVGNLPGAGQRLQYYLYRYVNKNGSLNYYGPSVAEHGQLLCLAAQVATKTNLVKFIQYHLPVVRSIWRRLLDIRERMCASYAQADAHYGLIPGLPEADYHNKDGQWEQFYYAGDLWVCRALREWGRALVGSGLEACVEEGQALLAEADVYREDILRSLRAVGAFDNDFVPPGPDQTEPFDCMTTACHPSYPDYPDRHLSYVNYRYWPEMISSGELPAELMTKIVNWRATHGGDLLGTTRFAERLDDWPVIHYARALLELDMIDRYLLLMYGHLAHHHDPGTLISYEQVSIETSDGARRRCAGQVAPCQFVLPNMLGWALAYEDRDGETIWLMRGVPKRWWDAPGTIVGPPLHTNEGLILQWEVEVRQDGAVLSFVNASEAGRRLVLKTRAKQIASIDAGTSDWAYDVRVGDDGESVIIPAGVRSADIEIVWE